MKIIGVSTPSTFLIGDDPNRVLEPGRVVDLEVGKVYEPMPIGSILKQGYWEPYDDTTGEATVMVNQILAQQGEPLLPERADAKRNV